MEVDAVHVHQVDRVAPQRRGDPLAQLGMHRILHRVGHRALRQGERQQRGGGGGTGAGQHDGAVAEARQVALDQAQHLLRPANRIRPDRGEGEGDLQDGQCHGTAAASCRKRSPDRPQEKFS